MVSVQPNDIERILKDESINTPCTKGLAVHVGTHGELPRQFRPQSFFQMLKSFRLGCVGKIKRMPKILIVHVSELIPHCRNYTDAWLKADGLESHLCILLEETLH